jgi:ketosteroid isomerase-like protein
MHKLLLISAVFLAFARPTFGQIAEQRPSDHEAIQKVLDQQVEAWNRGDLEGYMAVYWKSPHLTFYSGGTITRGWDGTLARYRERYQSAGREMGKLGFSEVRIEMLSDRAAFVRGRWQLTTADTLSKGLFTLMMRRLSQGWKIIHDHTSAE